MSDFPTDETELMRLIVSSDVPRARDWYTNVLGATVYRDWGDSCIVSIVRHRFVLVMGGGPTEDKPTVTFTTPPDPDLVSSEFIFRVPDCQEAYEALSRRGAEFLAPPSNLGWEIRAFFRDPDGHLFEISQLLKPE